MPTVRICDWYLYIAFAYNFHSSSSFIHLVIFSSTRDWWPSSRRISLVRLIALAQSDGAEVSYAREW